MAGVSASASAIFTRPLHTATFLTDARHSPICNLDAFNSLVRKFRLANSELISQASAIIFSDSTSRFFMVKTSSSVSCSRCGTSSEPRIDTLPMFSLPVPEDPRSPPSVADLFARDFAPSELRDFRCPE